MIKNLLKRISFKIAYLFWNEDDMHNLLHDKFKQIKILDRNQFAYQTDGLFTIHNADFIDEPLFKESYKLGKATKSWGNNEIQWRAYVACWAAKQVKELPGDFVECGVNRGGLSRTIINYIDFKSLNKKFILMDTFNGLDDEFVSETEKNHGLNNESFGYSECYVDVKKTFEEFNTDIIRGAIPATLEKAKTDNICFISIDMNCVAPEIAAAEYFWDKIVKGGIVLLDDYGWPNHIEQKHAFDDFAKKKGIQILSLPTGQGLIVKY
jgi:O-methyltransferase